MSSKEIRIVLPNNQEFKLSVTDKANLVVKGFIYYTGIVKSSIEIFDEEDENQSTESRLNFKIDIKDETPLKKLRVAGKRKYRIKGYPPGSIPTSDKVDEMCQKEIEINKKCTFNFTKKQYRKQKFYRCYTCGVEGNLGVCETCKDVCHSGHHVVYAGILPSYCDCGDSNPKVKIQCKCMKDEGSTSKRKGKYSSVVLRRCTIKITGREFYRQKFYRCITCGFDDASRKGCCAVCKNICHKGHQVTYVGEVGSYCDCGDGTGPQKCKCLE